MSKSFLFLPRKLFRKEDLKKKFLDSCSRGKKLEFLLSFVRQMGQPVAQPACTRKDFSELLASFGGQTRQRIACRSSSTKIYPSDGHEEIVRGGGASAAFGPAACCGNIEGIGNDRRGLQLHGRIRPQGVAGTAAGRHSGTAQKRAAGLCRPLHRCCSRRSKCAGARGEPKHLPPASGTSHERQGLAVNLFPARVTSGWPRGSPAGLPCSCRSGGFPMESNRRAFFFLAGLGWSGWRFAAALDRPPRTVRSFRACFPLTPTAAPVKNSSILTMPGKKTWGS